MKKKILFIGVKFFFNSFTQGLFSNGKLQFDPVHYRSLPWEENNYAKMGAEYKRNMMSNLNTFLGECFSSENIEIFGALVQYLKFIQIKTRLPVLYDSSKQSEMLGPSYTLNGDN